MTSEDESSRLKRAILALSEAKNWADARDEWGLVDVWFEAGGTCLGGHHPITEHCEIKNALNANTRVVGNCCVKRFMGLPSDKIFAAIKRLRQDAARSMNQETLDHAKKRWWISDWEYDFYGDIMRKRNLSAKQESNKIRINEKVLARMDQSRYDRMSTALASPTPPSPVPPQGRRPRLLGIGGPVWLALERRKP